MESLQLGNGDEDNDGLLAALDVDLTSRRDLEGSQLGLDLRDVVLQVQESLGDLLLNLGGGSARGVGRAAMSVTLERAKRRHSAAAGRWSSKTTSWSQAEGPGTAARSALDTKSARDAKAAL